MNEDVHSDLLLRCALWLARAEAFRAEAKRAIARRDQAKLFATANTLEWAAIDLTALIKSLEGEEEADSSE